MSKSLGTRTAGSCVGIANIWCPWENSGRHERGDVAGGAPALSCRDDVCLPCGEAWALSSRQWGDTGGLYSE